MTELLTQLREHNIKLWVEEDRLRFRAPKGAMTAEIQAKIAAHKAELMAFLRTAQQTPDANNVITPAPRTGGLPLALTQERVWFLDQMQAGANASFNMPAVLRLDGALNVLALEQSLNALLERHESLRTNIVLIEGVPQQVIAPVAPYCLPVVELNSTTHPQDLTSLAATEAARPFDLAHDALLRTTLLRLSAESHVLLLTLHHIISDGWSLKIMIEEIAALYWAFANGQPSPLPAPELQYADYAVWQRERLQGERLQAELDYWKQALAGAPQLLEMPTYQPRPAVQRFNGSRVSFEVDAELAGQLHELCQRTNTTLAMLLLSAYQLLLARYSNQSDLVVGMYVANRNHKQIESLLGFFVNTLLMRADVSDNPTVTDFLARVRQTSLNAYSHQEVPFARLAEELHPERDLSYTPLYQASYVFQGQDQSAWTMANLHVQLDKPNVTHVKDDLALEMAEVGAALRGALDYNTDLYAPEFVAGMATHYKVLLRGMAANPTLRVLDLPLLTKREAQAQMTAWAQAQNNGTNNINIELPFVQQFEAQAERTPDAIAVQQDHARLTYAELNARANKWAHQLIRQGVQADVIVTPYFERSIDFLTAILAIFKAGGAYLPLDPRMPAARLAQILAQSGTPLVLTNQAYFQRVQDSVQGLSAAPAVLLVETLDGQGSDPNRETNGNPPQRSTADNLAYIIFTSGSTGVPKGVMVEQRGLMNHLAAMRSNLGMTDQDVIGQTATQSWVISVWQFLAALTAGARVQIVADAKMLDTHDLLDEIARHQISVVEIVPSVMRLLVESLPHHAGGLPACVRWLIPTGEALPPALARAWFAVCPGVPLLNAYGSSECSDDVAHDVITAPPADTVLNMPIGPAIQNVQMLVLDNNLRPLPVGVAGELYVGGAGVGRGYLADEALTSQKFISTNRIAGTDQNDRIARSDLRSNLRRAPSNNPVRLYKTGDRVRVLPTGKIEYLGRVDFQVKVRGIRIELGEIEAVLSKHPNVAQCVLVARVDAHNATQLVAYVVANGAPGIGELRSFVAERLPEYMVPATVVLLQAMPLNNSGKLDRKALPAPNFGAQQTENFVAPSTETETVLADIWRDILKLNQVSVTSSFFELGGHSLLATQVASRIRQRLSVEVPLRALFEQPTILSLAQLIDSNEFRSTRPAITQTQRSETVPMSYSQQRLWLIEELQGASVGFVIPMALKIQGALDVAHLQTTLNNLVARHESLRTTFESVAGVPMQCVHPPKPVDMPIVDLRHLPQAERLTHAEQLAETLTNHPFDTRTGPLLRLTLYVLSEDEHVLFLAMHHIITDGWSLRIIVQEIVDGYQASLNDITRPPLDIQYADYALWQRQWLQGDVLRAQLAYWAKQLAAVPPTLGLATDHPRPWQSSFRSQTIEFVLDAGLTQDLHTLAKRNGSTLYMTVLAALGALLSRYSGQTDLVIGSPIANRTDAAIENLVGFFLNTLALRLQLADAPSFNALLQHVRQITLDAYANQDVPFEQIIEQLRLPRTLNQAPLLQTMLAWQDFSQSAQEQQQKYDGVAGLHVQPLEWKKAHLDMDMMLSMGESHGELVGTWEYSTDLFDADTMTRMLAHFQNVLRAVVAEPDKPITELPLLSASEAVQAVIADETLGRDYPLHLCAAQVFEAQVERTPDAIAVSCDDDSATYRQLNERANRWARVLVQHGVSAEVIVLPFFERGIDFVTAMLAIFKSGGAYLPLDPHTPTARLHQILTQSRPPLVLTNSRFAEPVQAALADLAQPPQLLLIETLDAQEAATTNLEPRSTPDNLAYIIFTSGSTGVPKGVMVEQRGLVNHLCAMQTNLKLTDSDVIGQTATQSYVISVWQFLAALTVGARVQIVSEDIMLDSLALLDEIEQRNISIVQIVPSVMRLVVEAVSRRATGLPACLRWMIPTGEALPPALVKAWFAACRGGRVVPLLNAYGSSECSDDVTHDVITEPPGHDVLNMPAGYPIPNVSLRVLDPQGQPVPRGVVGELVVSGAGVGRGYLFDEVLTAQKFVSNVRIARSALSAPSDDVRSYKTGDRARVLANGKIEVLGRMDFQVKIRGIRIELGEIEAVLAEHVAVAQVVLVARNDAQGTKQLVAYVVAYPNTSTTAQDLRAYVGLHLPDYMVPAAIVMLAHMPLNASGKVDRKALPVPTQLELSNATQYVAARTETEASLVDIVSTVLGIAPGMLGVQHNFFELGGHSLQAMQIVWRLREAFGVDVPLRALFETPTVSAVAEQIGRASATLNRPIITKADRSKDLALSYAQQRLWLLDQLDEGGGYVIPAALKLSGYLDSARLQASLGAMVARHESLRTTFESADGLPVQRIHAPAPVALPIVDLRHLPAAEREAEAHRLANEALQEKFDLEHGPLLRCTLYQTDDHTHLLYVLMHHIITDGWSIPIMAGEVMQQYADPHAAEALPALAVQYADYAQWQRNWLQGDVLQSQLNYWTTQLSDAPPLIELPTDRPRTTTPTFKADSVDFVIEADLTEKLNALATKTGATPYMLMVGAYALLLSRYSGQSDVVIGTPIANRPDAALDGLIGFFVNTLALRININNASSVHALLREVKRVTLDGYAHQDVSFEQIVDALKLPRTLSHTPVFQVLFAWQNFSRPALQTDAIAGADGTLRIEGHAWKKTTIEYDLVLSMSQTSQTSQTDAIENSPSVLLGTWEFSTDLFDRATVQRMVLHFKNLLGLMVAHADSPINTLPTLSDAEAKQLLTKTSAAQCVPATVHGLFQAQAAQHPDATALVFEDEHMTYAELDAQTTHLAQHLQAQGVGVGQRVAICAERSIEMVIAALGVMKAGAAYVPLDPSYPAERLQFMLSDADVSLVLTQYEWVKRLPASRVLVIEEIMLMSVASENKSIAQGAPSALSDVATATPDDPVYIIYTSGSTGQPKGVVVPHKGVANTVQGIAQATKMGIEDRFLEFAPFAFDASALQMFTPLTCGATLVLHPNPSQLSINELHEFCLKQRLTVVDFVAAFWQQWVETLSAQGVRLPAHLRVCLTGGDKISAHTVQTWAALADHEMTFLCSYGPTEASITTTAYVTTNHAVLRNAPKQIGLGAPLPNMAIYVLDAHGQLAPTGVPGEVYIGGVGVAQGYWQQDALTQQKFSSTLPAVNAHLNGSSPKRFYRTGDLARWLPDGTCEFVGRVDTQVKIRGFRIELGEIETQIKQLPQVREAVVQALAFGEGEKRLVAYVEFDPIIARSAAQSTAQSAPSNNELSISLRGKLPPHMLPSVWVPMTEWPLTPSGKLDRNALPKPELNDTAAQHVAPRNPLEAELTQMWGEVLGIAAERVSVESDFFEMGGHSLLAMQVVARIRQAHGIDFPLRSLMESPTIATMAQVLGRLKTTLERLRPNATPDTTEHTEQEMELIEL